MSAHGEETDRPTSAPGERLTPTQERWLARSRWARFVWGFLPTLAGAIAVVFVVCLIAMSGKVGLLGFFVALEIVLYVLPCALAAGLVAAVILAVTDNKRGAGAVALAAVAGGVLIPTVVVIVAALLGH